MDPDLEKSCLSDWIHNPAMWKASYTFASTTRCPDNDDYDSNDNGSTDYDSADNDSASFNSADFTTTNFVFLPNILRNWRQILRFAKLKISQESEK